jgi:hypothetical protein
MIVQKKIYEDWRKFKKYKTRKTDIQKPYENKFEEQLEDLFYIAHAKVLSLLIEEYKQFLLKQREKRHPSCMLGTDMKLANIEKRRASLEEKEDRRKNLQELETFKLTGKEKMYLTSQIYTFNNIFDHKCIIICWLFNNIV